eukprot:399021-Amphidinium_carterae.1
MQMPTERNDSTIDPVEHTLSSNQHSVAPKVEAVLRTKVKRENIWNITELICLRRWPMCSDQCAAAPSSLPRAPNRCVRPTQRTAPISSCAWLSQSMPSPDT